MEQVAVSKFKATCLSIVERVRKTGKPVVITKFGVPVARLLPSPPPNARKSWLGCMEGRKSLATF